jgi:hypothetical protein
MKQKITIVILVALTILLFSCQNTGKLHTGWYSTAKLKKKGYNVPANAPKQIYIKRTQDSTKANIVKH